METAIKKITITHGLIYLGFTLLSALGALISSPVLMGLFSVLSILAFFVLVIRAQLIGQKEDYDLSYGQALKMGFFIWLIGFIPGILFTIVRLAIVGNPLEGSASMTQVMAASFGTSVALTLFLILGATGIAGIWRVFEKAGKPGWGSIVPLYNLILMCEIGKKPTWWVFLCFIPFVNIVFLIMIYNGISKAFGKDEGWTVGLVVLSFIFWPLLGFGKNFYEHEEIPGEPPLVLEKELV